ncbi:MAG: TetR/AcrR family transcriptional regulator [Actinomycetia bacterium]|nr:TetR/AcrR family transcriptional regulator [Actinomycetes bacterium]
MPKEKQQLLEKMAIREFAAFGYDKASINRLVEQCQIAKGSFYQYFEDKKDLFLYLITRINEKKLKFMSPVFQNPENHDFFTLIRKMFMSGIKFAADNPEITMMGNWLFKNKSHPIYDEIVGIGLQNAQNIYTELLELAISRGEIRDNININFVSHIISSMNVSAVEYYFQNIKEEETDMLKFDESIIGTVDLLIDFIKYGIGTQKKGGSSDD